jgi:hypothetical protein
VRFLDFSVRRRELSLPLFFILFFVVNFPRSANLCFVYTSSTSISRPYPTLEYRIHVCIVHSKSVAPPYSFFTSSMLSQGTLNTLACLKTHGLVDTVTTVIISMGYKQDSLH